MFTLRKRTQQTTRRHIVLSIAIDLLTVMLLMWFILVVERKILDSRNTPAIYLLKPVMINFSRLTTYTCLGLGQKGSGDEKKGGGKLGEASQPPECTSVSYSSESVRS